MNKWSETAVVNEVRPMVAALGYIPTSRELSRAGRGDLSNAISKFGGWRHFASLLGSTVKPSDTLTGWKAEDEAINWLTGLGYFCEKQKSRTHFDVMVNGILRVEIKGASFAKYGYSAGWFYRLGRTVTADVVVFVRMDRHDFYVFPWFRVPATNLTITPSGKAHAYYHMNLGVLRDMLELRAQELSAYPRCERGAA